MPVPTLTDPPPNLTPTAASSSKPQGQPSQKSMTKAERRELQEKQRAAKAALKAQQQSDRVQPKALKSPAAAQKKTQAGETPKQAAPSAKEVAAAAIDEATGGKAVSRSLRIFSHFGLPKPVSHVKGNIHPAIIRLGLLFSEFKICGANARCIATLTAFKSVIQDYTTPPNHTLSRHLMTHLSPQITHLVSARPMSVTMGNAIRQLKLEISNSDIDMVEQDAKNALCQKIDNYIRDRIIIADEVIQELAGNKINDGDVVLTFARSSVVEKILLNAQEEGKKISVIVIDSPPLLELLNKLTSGSNPIPCTYALLPALPSLITEVTAVLLGAHALFSNGAVYSRAGTALVAMMAKGHGLPVMVCCETYKFSEGVMVDGFGKNELAPVKVTQSTGRPEAVSPSQNLEILNPLYDLTPATFITAVVTEVGLIPPSSISSIPLALGKTTF
ncbi:putative translation initiation factor eIF-2B subunit delta [Leucoagaricus sp. SymC.cos]|nr:putative translation initiation factor eIF-2B subunit delta [Leucoagaricus sp. SymC.cos]